MRVVVIGGKGHVGTYLIPRLVEAGHTVINVSRGEHAPYQPHPAWEEVRQVTIDRAAAEADGNFGERIRALDGEVVIDMICFTLDSAKQLVEALRGRVQHFLHCGTIWIHGPTVVAPTTEDQPRKPFGEYGMQKAAIEAYLLDEARRKGFPATALHPGHIVGPGWNPLNPAGHFNPIVFSQLARQRNRGAAQPGHGDRAPCPCRRRGAGFHAGHSATGAPRSAKASTSCRRRR